MNDKTLPPGIKLAIKMTKDVLILDNKISIIGLAGKKKELLKITYYSKLGLIKFEETCHKDKAIKRLSQLKGKIIDLRIPCDF